MKRAVKANLCDDLMVEILLRLPTKSLIRFRCVSKSWQALLTDSKFIGEHLKLAKTQHDNQGFIVSSLKSIYFIRRDHKYDDSESIRVRLIDKLFQNTVFRVIGSCDGLLCIALQDTSLSKNILLLNPSTREYRELLLPKDVNIQGELFGFGYDSYTNDYKVVRGPSISYPNIEVLALKSTEWKMVQVNVLHRARLEDQTTLLNGCLYWIALIRNPATRGVIACFDLVKEKLIEVPTPHGGVDASQCKMGTLEGVLYMLECNPSTDKQDLWIMVEDGIMKSWIKFFRIRSLGLLNKPLSFSPIYFSRNGNDLIVVTKEKVLLYDPYKRTSEALANLEDMNLLTLHPHVETLISPSMLLEESDKKKERDRRHLTQMGLSF